jgi:hypothetical protein
MVLFSLMLDILITVFSSNNADQTWMAHQHLLIKLTNYTSQIKTHNQHSIHLENPEIAIEAITNSMEQIDKKTIIN